MSLSLQSPVVKVFLDEPALGALQSYTVRMARGEYESFQLLVTARGEDLHDVVVTAAPLPGIQVEIRLAGYVQTRPDDRRPWGRAGKIGWWPDPLLPSRPFDVRAGETQPVWVTLFAPAGTPAGTYTGALSLKAGNDVGARCGYGVKVFDVDLPKKQRLHNFAFMPAGNLRAHYRAPGGLEGAAFLQLYKRWAAFAFEHHLGPAFDMLMGWNQTQVRPPLEAGSLGPTPEMVAGGGSYVTWPVRQLAAGYDFGTVRELVELGAPYGLEQFCIALFDREQRWDQQNQKTRSAMADLLRAYTSWLREQGLAQGAFVYNVDEPGPAMWETVKKNFEFVHGVDPKLKVWLCLNEIKGVKALTGYTDIWDVYIRQYDQSGIEERRRAGEQVIWAVCVWPHEHPNLFIEYPAMDARIIGWLTYLYRVSGFEYWGLNQWGGNTGRSDWAPFQNGDTRTQWQRTKWPLGDGWLLYPGPAGQPLSSVRLENLRDGFEDAELLLMLDSRGMSSQARSIAQRIARTTQDFTSDPLAVESAHEALLKALSSANPN